MKLRLAILLSCMSLATMALAQASGGQISRKKPKTTGNSKVGYKHKVAKHLRQRWMVQILKLVIIL